MDDEFSGEMTFKFRLGDGSPLIVSTGIHYKSHFGQLYRSLRAKHGYVETIGFDGRPEDHPGVVAENAELRRRLHEARSARG